MDHEGVRQSMGGKILIAGVLLALSAVSLYAGYLTGNNFGNVDLGWVLTDTSIVLSTVGYIFAVAAIAQFLTIPFSRR